MRTGMIVVVGATLMLGGCGDGGPPPKRQPGSWSQKIEVLRYEGPSVQPGTREQVQQMFDVMSGMSICVTPEAAAQEDFAEELQKTAGGGNCTFDKKIVTSKLIDMRGTCVTPAGDKLKVTMTGKAGAAEQQVTATVEGPGSAKEVKEMRLTKKRTGECKPGDITPPALPAPAAKK